MPTTQSDGVVKYRQIANILRERIRRGHYRVGDKIPSYSQLCEIYSVSETTIRQAVAMLANEELLRRERGRGKGVFVNPPPRPGSGNAPRRLMTIQAGQAYDSDDPAILPGILSAVDASECSLFLMPPLSGGARIDYLKHLVRNAGTDGVLIKGCIFPSDTEARAMIAYLEESGIRYVVMFSAEGEWADRLLEAGQPGVYMNEQDALTAALEKALRRGSRRLLFTGTGEYPVGRSLEVVRKSKLVGEFQVESRIFDELGTRSLFRSFEKTVLEAAAGAATLVVEGSNLPLSYVDSVLEAHRLRPGEDVSLFFFEHYCNLNPVFLGRYSSITRPYFELGRIAGGMLQRMVVAGEPGRCDVIRAAFNDLNSI